MNDHSWGLKPVTLKHIILVIHDSKKVNFIHNTQAWKQKYEMCVAASGLTAFATVQEF
jgi:methylglyoxal synthase